MLKLQRMNQGVQSWHIVNVLTYNVCKHLIQALLRRWWGVETAWALLFSSLLRHINASWCHWLCLYSFNFEVINCWIKHKSTVISLNRRGREDFCTGHRENRTEQEQRSCAVSRADLLEKLTFQRGEKFHIFLPLGKIWSISRLARTLNCFCGYFYQKRYC